MHYLVSVVFDEEHRGCYAVDAETKEEGEAALLEEFHFQPEDVLEIDATPEKGTRAAK